MLQKMKYKLTFLKLDIYHSLPVGLFRPSLNEFFFFYFSTRTIRKDNWKGGEGSEHASINGRVKQSIDGENLQQQRYLLRFPLARHRFSIFLSSQHTFRREIGLFKHGIPYIPA